MNFTRLCRACAKQIGEECKGVHLFEESSNIMEIFAKCTSLEIDQLDMLPAYICEDCNSKLINLHQFRLICASSDIYFRGKLLTTSVQVKDEIFEIDEVKCETATIFAEEFVKVESIEEGTESIEEGTESIEEETESNCTEETESNFTDETENSFTEETPTSSTSIGIKECDICGKTFYKRHILEGHLRKHVGLKAFQCDICDKGVSRMSRLIKHKEIYHQNGKANNDSSKPFKCDLGRCRRSYMTLKSLEGHIKCFHLNIKRQRGGGRPHRCTHCNKTFKRKETLDGHVRQHQGLDPFECKECGATFQKNRYLLTHMHAKHDENFQRIPCDYDGCSKTFSSQFGLRQHKRYKHMGIKPKAGFGNVDVCERCGMSFKNKTSFRNHMYSHLDGPFACTYCPRKFSIKNCFKVHMKRHESGLKVRLK